MEPGNIVEYIDRQKIICAVVMEVNHQRLRLLNENNREVKMSDGRLSHKSRICLDLSLGRDRLSTALKEKARNRKSLSEAVPVEEVWSVLNSEQEWIDLPTMTAFCFSGETTGDHEAAVVRAFFQNRLFFKFDTDRFFPYTPDQMEQLKIQAAEADRRERIIEGGGEWLRQLMTGKSDTERAIILSQDQKEVIEILKSYYLFDKESPHYEIGRTVLGKAGVMDPASLFDVFIRLKVWDPDENIDIHRFETPTHFPEAVLQETLTVIHSAPSFTRDGRRDLTGLKTFTIDGQATLDYDDALSIEDKGDHILLGVHIADVGHFVEHGGVIDREAVSRGSSIYMPDQKIPMLPQILAESHCSLKAGELRPAISTSIRLAPTYEILDYEIFPSIIRVTDQLSYYDVNLLTEEDKGFILLHEIARHFRKKRLSDGAVHISLPELNIWIDEQGDLVVSKTNRESPGRMLVAELMIMANWLMARFLHENGLPAVFRSQPDPRDRLYKEDEGNLFQNWMQRKLLSRFVLGPSPERHTGLGLAAYVTATSPIRKYFDLITQRQIRSIFGLNPSYSQKEIEQKIQILEQPMIHVARLQSRRKRYWLLKYLEKRIGIKEDAIVLDKRKNGYLVLITDYLMECVFPASNGIHLRPEDLIQVTIQNVNARKDLFSVQMG